MLELLSKYSFSEIIMFIVLLGVAIKELITFMDWASERLKRTFKKESNQEQSFQEVKDQISNLSNQLADSVKSFHDYIEVNTTRQQEVHKAIEILMESDKDDIKSWITAQHHYFCYEKGFIDDYSLDCIERRFKHYEDEGGNSFIASLMKEIRALPKVSMCNNITHHHNDDKENEI